MGTAPNPRTWVDGEVVTPQDLNTEIRDAIGFYLDPPFCHMELAASWTMTSNSYHDVPFDTVLRDSDGMADLSQNKVVIQTDGYYFVQGQCAFSSGTTSCRATLAKNGNADFCARQNWPDGTQAVYQFSGYANLVKGDVIGLWAFHNTGSDKTNASPSQGSAYRFQIKVQWVGNPS